VSRVPSGEWTAVPIDGLASKYDSVENHGWYRNLLPTLDEVQRLWGAGDLICDYSGGTGILADWLFERAPDLEVGLGIADSSPKFLRLALEKLRGEERVAFRLIRFLKELQRLELLEEVLEAPLLERKLDGLVSTNAVHLYYDLPATVASWLRILRAGAAVHVQSGNIRNPSAEEGSWIIDETVEAIHNIAKELVASDPFWAAYRPCLDDEERMARYDALRAKYFLPVRPLDHYLGVFEQAGLTMEKVTCQSIDARVLDWFQFLAAYHEGVLGWVGGVPKLEGVPSDKNAERDRLRLMKQAVDKLFGSRDAFKANWSYMTWRAPG